MTYKARCSNDGRGRFDKALAHLKEQLKRHPHRPSLLGLVDNVRVDYYGTADAASTNWRRSRCPEPRQIVIKPFDASVLTDDVARPSRSRTWASRTAERRQGHPIDDAAAFGRPAQEVRRQGQGAVRGGARLDAQHRAATSTSTPDQPSQKSGELTEDENKKLHGEIQDLLKEFEKKVDETLKHKVDEIQDV